MSYLIKNNILYSYDISQILTNKLSASITVRIIYKTWYGAF